MPDHRRDSVVHVHMHVTMLCCRGPAFNRSHEGFIAEGMAVFGVVSSVEF